MTAYLSEHAIAELADVGSKILSKANRDLKKKRVFEVASMYSLVRRQKSLREKPGK